MIHPVYGETDYRKIDQAKLNRNIPHGRGMIKWAPFATMPQQHENIKRQIAAQHTIKRPELSDDRLEEINYTLKAAVGLQRPLLIDYYNDGFIRQLTMSVDRIDQWGMLIIGTNCANNQHCFISFLDIVNLALH